MLTLTTASTLLLATLFPSAPPEVQNLGLAGGNGVFPGVERSGRWRAFLVYESSQGGLDLNGDGDVKDAVVHVLDARRGRVQNFGLVPRKSSVLVSTVQAAPLVNSFAFGLVGDVVVCQSDELQNGVDHNGDGDLDDIVILVHDLRSGTVHVLDLYVLQGGTSRFSDALDADGRHLIVRATVPSGTSVLDLETGARTDFGGLYAGPPCDGRVALVKWEGQDGVDENGDGDALDQILYVGDLETGRSASLGLATSGVVGCTGLALISEVDEGYTDLNGDGLLTDLLFRISLDDGSLVDLGVISDPLFGFLSGWLDPTPVDPDWFPVLGWKPASLLPGAYVWSSSEQVLTELSIPGGTLFGAGSDPRTHGRFLVQGDYEGALVGDLNGDGDTQDVLVRIHDERAGTDTTLPYALERWSGPFAPFREFWIRADGTHAGLVLSEQDSGVDLDGDGATTSRIAAVVNLRTSEITSLGWHLQDAREFRFGSGTFWALVDESSNGLVDLNGDGDVGDRVLHSYDVQHAVATNHGLAANGHSFLQDSAFWIADGAAYVYVSESGQGGVDLNGDGDVNDSVLHVVR